MDWGAVGTVVIGYLLGSIPFGIVITRIAGKGDIRDIGSGNIGAINVLRTGSKPLAALTLLGDGFKGTAAVLIGSMIGGPWVAVLAGFGAFLGHLFPVWLKFRGGKGVATYLGVLAGLDWQLALVFAAIWIGTAVLTRLSSASALVATFVAPLTMIPMGHAWGTVLVMALMAVILWLRHAGNIRRLLAGEESRIGEKSSP